MDLQRLKTFVGVARYGSFVGAARQLDLDPSLGSRAIATLERELGVRLVQRTTRRHGGKTLVVEPRRSRIGRARLNQRSRCHG
jgi:DNA-binding transcriptional LysR family regulator